MSAKGDYFYAWQAEKADHAKTLDAAEKAADMIAELRNAVVVATAEIERLQERATAVDAVDDSRRASLSQYRKRLADACDKAVLREQAIERNGGSTEEITEARTKADAYSDALAWAAAL